MGWSVGKKPAWWLADFRNHRAPGLDSASLDLYSIARYQDETVSDGSSGIIRAEDARSSYQGPRILQLTPDDSGICCNVASSVSGFERDSYVAFRTRTATWEFYDSCRAELTPLQLSS